MADNYFKGKDMDGTFANGQGPIMGLTTSYESETKGVISGGEGGGKNLTVMGGGTVYPNPQTPTDQKLFDLRGASYRGPENMLPDDHGVSNPFETNSG